MEKKILIVHDAKQDIKKLKLFYYIFCYKKNLEISFQNRPEHEITSLRLNLRSNLKFNQS